MFKKEIIKIQFVTLFFLLCCFTLAEAAKGPKYRSLRVHGMGGAFVAVADNKDALYYNPAGLNLIGSFEDFKDNPDMGYMPRQPFELRLLTVSTAFPANEITEVIDICGAPKMATIIKKLLMFDFGYYADVDWCPVYSKALPRDTDRLVDSLNANPELLENLTSIDRKPLEIINVQISILEFAMHNFGFSTWINTSAAPYIDVGMGVPGFGYEPIQTDVVTQTAFAFSPIDRWSFGVGFKAAKRYWNPKRQFYPKLKLDLSNFPESFDAEANTDELDSLHKYWENFAKDSLTSFKNIGFGMDFGALYQITRTLRLGTSVRDVFFNQLAGESITPNLSMGVAYTPMFLQSNSWWGRKVNFAMDYVDVLDGTVGDMFFSHLNFGAEIEQVILPSPTRDMSFLPCLLFSVAGGAAGALIGYVAGGDGVGSAIGAGVGGMLGFGIGRGRDVLRTSVGGGFEGGYYAWNIGLSIAEAVNMRFGSYAEERGVRTGQKEHRYWTGELSLGF